MNNRIIALAGNPNSGKTTLFNQLTGSNQYVGNWPGVTVEKKEGKLKGHPEITILDLPGIYSLSDNSPEEVIASQELTSGKIDLILNIVDGTNLERNLYLSSQLMDMGLLPMVFAINLSDIWEKDPVKPDLAKLSEKLGAPAIAISASKGNGINELISQLTSDLFKKSTTPSAFSFSPKTTAILTEVESKLKGKVPETLLRFWAIKALENSSEYQERFGKEADLVVQVDKIRTGFEEAVEDDAQAQLAVDRYESIGQIMKQVQPQKKSAKKSISDRLDAIITNRWLALPIFALVMFIVYGISVTTIGAIATDWTNDVLFGEIVPNAVGGWLEALQVEGWLQSLILDGIVGGVGAILGFVPQILILFFFLAFLEGSGYLARVAFIMDRIFRKFGLSGKSFIPMLIGSGCSVPGIMASRTIESERDRRMTVTVTSFIPCSAKLPVIALIAGALFSQAWWVSPSIYFLGIAAVIVSGIMLKKTRWFSGPPVPFVMELPPYRWPTLGFILRSMWERGWSFIKKAGTVILLSTVMIWFLSQFGISNGALIMVEDSSESILAGLGRNLAWIFTPLGWGDWKSTVATVTGLVAKENVVGTFGVLFNMAELAEDGAEIWDLIAQHFTALAGYSFLIFNMICAPCFAAIGAIKREMNSAKWTWFAILYQTIFAYILALICYQLGTWLTGGIFTVWTAIAVLALGVLLYLLFRPAPKQAQIGLNNPVLAHRI